jgi:hypothetical protein
MRRIRSPCCARAASDHAAAPPSRVMNLRRLHRWKCINNPPAETHEQDTRAGGLGQ